MHVYVFNATLLVGWLLFTAGAVMVHPGAGLAASGLLLIVLLLVCVRLAGRLYGPAAQKGAA